MSSGSRRRPVWQSVAVIVSAALLVVVALVAAAWWWLGGVACDNNVLDDQPSPDGRHHAVTFTRDCGATTAYSTQLSILPTGRTLSARDGGNVLVIDADYGAAPAGPGGGPAIVFRWLDARTLEVRHHPSVRVFRYVPLLDGVVVRVVTDSIATHAFAMTSVVLRREMALHVIRQDGHCGRSPSLRSTVSPVDVSLVGELPITGRGPAREPPRPPVEALYPLVRVGDQPGEPAGERAQRREEEQDIQPLRPPAPRVAEGKVQRVSFASRRPSSIFTLSA